MCSEQCLVFMCFSICLQAQAALCERVFAPASIAAVGWSDLSIFLGGARASMNTWKWQGCFRVTQHHSTGNKQNENQMRHSELKKLNYFILSCGIPIRLDIFTLKTSERARKGIQGKKKINQLYDTLN